MSRPTVKFRSPETKKSFDDKLKDANQDNESPSEDFKSDSEPQEIAKKPKKTDYQIELDDATIETLKQRHNLTVKRKKASFHWNASKHKALKNLCNDTEQSAEFYLEQWAIEGLERALKKFYKEI